MTGSKREYLDSVDGTSTGYDLALTILVSESTILTEEYQIQDGKVHIKLPINDDGIVQNRKLMELDQFWAIMDRALPPGPVSDANCSNILLENSALFQSLS